jgi:S1-C subfamily serine protease/outer membrane murein-binding lipoprotein Lpp
MKRRFSSGTGSTSFFAFQDIITAVTGIMVLIALLMALQITSGQPSEPRVDPKLASALAELSARRDDLHAKVEAIRATAKPAALGSEDAAAQLANIEDMIRELNRESARLVQDSETATASNPSPVDLDSVRRGNQEAKDSIAQAEKQNKRLAAEITEIEQKVEKAQTAALEVASNNSDIWLTPDRSDTSKEPVIVSVMPDTMTAQRLDAGQESKVNRTSDTEKSLSELLKGTKPTDQFLVFYFKPSTLAGFDDVIKAAKSLGYEVGYDIVEEEGVVRFTSSAEEKEPPAQPEPTATPQSDDMPAVAQGEVDIHAEVDKRGDPVGNGSGFFIDSSGYFVTNDHVAAAGKIYFIGSKSSGWRQAKLVGADEENDLALLKIEHETEPFVVSDSDAVKLGQTVATIGFPNIELQGLSPKFTKGEISSLAGIQDDPATFQISVPVQPGNSGGALFDESGRVVGVVSARLNQDAAVAVSGTHAENVNYAVKSKVLLEWLQKLEAPGLELRQKDQGSVTFQDAIQHAEQSTAMILVYP